MRLHIGSGSVYLSCWLNVDLPAANTFLAADRPDLVEQWRTIETDYYRKHSDLNVDALRAGPLDQEYVCDRYGSFDFLPVPNGSVDEILTRQSFEHLSIAEARRALDCMFAALETGGILRIDVPDHEKTLRLYRETGDHFYMRHLLGPRRNEHGFHMMSYTPDRLRALVESRGFRLEAEEPNVHFYPAMCLRFKK